MLFDLLQVLIFMGSPVHLLTKISFYSVAKTPGSDAWRSWWILPFFPVFSITFRNDRHLDLPLFVSTLIFIRMKDALCQLSVNIHFVFGSTVSKLSSRGFICFKCLPLYFRHLQIYSCFYSVDKIMAVLQPPPLHCSHFILLTQDKSQTNVIELSGSLSLGAFIYLSGCSGLLSCQLILTDS